jgi:hypothetical protein
MHSTFRDDYLHRWGKAPNLVNSVTYHDHRHFLSLKSVLRFFGQSRQCCPKRYFLDAKVAEESLLRDIVGANKIVKIVEERGYANNLKPCDEENSQSIKDFLNSEEVPIMYYHDIPYNLWLFKERLYFHHANYRPYIKYKRVGDEKYRADAVQSIATGQQVNGVQGFWPFAGLEYSRIEETLSYCVLQALIHACSTPRSIDIQNT